MKESIHFMLDILLVKIRMDRGFREDLNSIHCLLNYRFPLEYP